MTDNTRWWHERTDARTDRAVSFTVSYVLTVAIATVLVTGVVVATGQVVRDQREETIRSGATVVGDQTAAGVMAADRLVKGGNESDITVRLQLPDRLAGQPYTVSLRATDASAAVIVTVESPAVTVSTPLTNRTTIANETVAGDGVQVVFRRASGVLTLAGDDS